MMGGLLNFLFVLERLVKKFMTLALKLCCLGEAQRLCAAQRGRDFEPPDLERGIHFRGVF